MRARSGDVGQNWLQEESKEQRRESLEIRREVLIECELAVKKGSESYLGIQQLRGNTKTNPQF